MAKIKWGLVVTDGRGKLGGHVLSKNRSGAVVRTKVTPVNAQSAAQLSVRNRFTTFSQGWRSLTSAQRAAWNAAVTDYQRTNVFGDLVSPSGFNLYQRLNNNLVTVGEVALTVPPLPAEVQGIEIQGLDYTVGTNELVVTVADAISADTKVKVFATAPQSAGRSYVKSKFLLVSVADSTNLDEIDMYTDYVAKFGSLGAVGQQIFVKLVAVAVATGQEGTPAQISAISAA